MSTTSTTKIVVIDDEESILEVIRIIMEEHDYQVDTFTNIPSMEQLLEIQPTIILLDVLVKGTDSKKFCWEIKHGNLTRKINVILLSAYTKSMLQEAKNTWGADNYLTKPFDMDTLVEMVKRYG